MRVSTPLGLFLTTLLQACYVFGIFSGSFAQTTITVGRGEYVSLDGEVSPINLNLPGLKTQLIYSAADIITAGGSAGEIIQLGFNVVSAPNQPLRNFMIRMKHTIEADAGSHDPGPFQPVLNKLAYTPTAGGFDLLTLDSPFSWNGTDHILIETCFYTPSVHSGEGAIRYDAVPNSFRFESSWVDPCAISTLTNNKKNTLPQLQLTFAETLASSQISVSVDSLFATLNGCEDSVTIPLTIYNTGERELIWNLDPTCNEVIVQMNAKEYSYEISWEIENEQGQVVASSPYYPSDYTTYLDTFCLKGGNYVFKAYDLLRDGWDDGGNAILNACGGSILSVNDFDDGSSRTYPFTLSPFCNLNNGLSFQSVQGTTHIEDSSTVNLTFSSSDLIAGTYQTELLISSNDLINPEIIIPIQLVLSGEPILSIPASCIDFPSTQEHTTKTDITWLTNSGCDSLVVDNIDVSDTIFSIFPTRFKIAPKDSIPLYISFSPIDTGYYQTTLNISGNIGDTAICIQSYGEGDPEILVSMDSISVVLNNCNDSIIIPLTIRNLGRGDLSYYIPIEEYLIKDGFEDGDYNEWILNDSTIFTPAIIDAGTGSGDYSLQITGGNRSVFNDLYQTFDLDQPKYISFKVRPTSTTDINASVIIGNSRRLGNGDIFFSAHPLGLLVYNGSTSSFVEYSENQWYSVEFKNINYQAKTFDFYVDHQKVADNFAFRAGNSSFDVIYLGNFDNSISYFDDIVIGDRPAQDWLIFSHGAGNITASDSVNIQIKLKAQGLDNGVYRTEIFINSNDPEYPSIPIPISFTVNGAAKLSLSNNCVDFDPIVQFTSVQDSFVVYNTGCDTLHIQDIIPSSSNYTILDFDSVRLSPRDSAKYIVHFSSDNIGRHDAILSLNTNLGIDSICLKAEVIGAPKIILPRDSLHANISNCADSVVINIPVINTGRGSLNFKVEAQGGGTDSLEVLALTHEVDLNRRYPNTIAAVNQYFSNYKLTEINTTSLDELRQALAGKDIVLLSEVRSGSADVYSTLRPALLEFINGGGSILFLGGGTLQKQVINNILPNAHAGIRQFGSLEILNYEHPLMQGINTINAQSTTYLLQFPNSNFIPLISQINQNDKVAAGYQYVGRGLAIYIGYDFYNYDMQLAKLIANAIDWAGRQTKSPNWLTITPDSSQVNVGDTINLKASFYSMGLDAGIYHTKIFFLSNDPLNSPLNIPTTLKISGGVSIGFSASTLSFDSTMLGFSNTQNLTIYNSLCDTMEITAISNSDSIFSFQDTLPLYVSPFDSVVLPLTFSPQAVANYSDSLIISYKVKDSLEVYDSLIYLQGKGIGTPSLAFSPDSLNVDLNACVDSITIPLTLYNDGSGEVNWTASVAASSVYLSDDFENGINDRLWAEISGGSINANCGTGSGMGALYFIGNSRQATTVPIRLNGLSVIHFHLFISTGLGNCEAADSGEEIVLEYALDGENWHFLKEYDVESFPTFSHVLEVVPQSAISSHTQFRWRQKHNTVFTGDNWAIDEVYFISETDSSLSVAISQNTGNIPPGDSTTMQVSLSVSQLTNGLHPFWIELQSNDPRDSIQYIPGIINISGQPIIQLTDGTIGTQKSFCYGSEIELVSDLPGQLIWSTGETTPSIFVRETDTVSVTLTYPNGCAITSLPVFVEESSEIMTDIAFTGDGNNCVGNLLDLSVSGGSPDYTYLWSTEESNQDISITTPGTYWVEVTDSENCVVRDSIQIDSLTVLSISSVTNHVQCYGEATGSIEIIVNGGEEPYTYRWDNGAETKDIGGLLAGSYTVTVTDNNGCTAQTTVQISQPARLHSYYYRRHVSCFGGSNGSINLEPYGGTAPYQYFWSNQETTEDIYHLRAGDYEVIITDQSGCTTTNSVTLTQPGPIVITEVASDSCGLASVEIDVRGGGGWYYIYEWSNGARTKNLRNVPPGEYAVVVTNSRGCKATDTFQLTTVLPPTKPTISANRSPVLCNGESVILTASTSLDILWSTGESTPSIVVTESGTYTVTTTDELGCMTTSDPMVVSVLPDARISANTDAICLGQSLTLTVEHASSVRWSTGDTTLSINVSPTIATTYTMAAINDAGCPYVDTITIDVLPALPPDAVMDMLPTDGAIELTQPLILSWPAPSNATTYDLYIWPQELIRPISPTIQNYRSNQIVLNNLENGTTYQWQVIAKNNCFSTPGTIQSFTLVDLPDLVVDTILVPTTTLFAGQNICINWRVRNQGLGAANGNWIERVYLSQNQVFDAGIDQLVGSVDNLSALEAGELSTLRQTCFDLPSCILGDYYVFIVVDPAHQLTETNKANNTGLNNNNPLDIALPPQPDLQVTNFFKVGTSALAAGSQMCVRWEVTNRGDSLTNDSVWIDRIYLMIDSVFDTRSVIRVYDFEHRGVLDSAKSYLVDTCIQLPSYVNGRYFLFLETDVFDDVNECSPSNIYEENNVSIRDTIDTFLPPPADLVVENVSAGLPQRLAAGSHFTIDWSIKNLGFNQSFQTHWQERVSLVPIDGNQTIHLGTFSFSGALANNEVANRTQTLRIPRRLSGLFNLCVTVDVFDQVYEASNEDNNTICESGLLTIAQSDLVVSTIRIPAIDSTNTPISISYFHKNIGSVALVNQTIRDRLYWSDSLGGTILFSAALPEYPNTNIASGDSVQRTLSLQPPPNRTGILYLCILTDRRNNISEQNENNNLSCSAGLQIKRSDLVVKNITVPTEISAGDTFSISWEVFNQGGANIPPTNWTDCIFLSPTPAYNPNLVVSLANLNHRNELVSGEYIEQEATLLAGEGLAGVYYLGIFTDCNDDIEEADQEHNNVQILNTPINIGIPDLTVGNIHSNTIVTANLPFSVNWTTINNGAKDLGNAFWTDCIYLSPTNNYNPNTAIPIGELSYSANLSRNGGAISKNTSVTIPYDISGDYYLIVYADCNNVIRETNREGNNTNVSSGLIRINAAPAADLIPTVIALHKDTITAGDAIIINYHITNQGDTTAFNLGWEDGFFLSNRLHPTGDFSNAIPLGTKPYYQPLTIGNSYSEQITFNTSPLLAEGWYRVYVYADVGQEVYEHISEENNWQGVSIYIQPYPPVDLAMTSLTADSTSILPGNRTNIDARVENRGLGTTLANNWTDGIYLSTDSIWDENDDLIAFYRISEQVQSGESYFHFNQNVTIPRGYEAGNYYLLLKADIYQNNQDINDTNNYIGVSIEVRQIFYPDLQISGFNCSNTATAGQPITLRWTVVNSSANGPTRNNGWSEGFYLETINGRIFLGSSGYGSNLSPGQSYTDSVSLTLPLSLPTGFYRVILKTDRNQAIYEGQNEDNNEAICNLQINAFPPADLIVSAITQPDSAFVGDSITISWTIENIGANQARGIMTQGVYISSDTSFSADDVFFGSISQHISLSPQTSLQYSLNGDLLGVQEGCFYVILRTDVLNNIFETNDANNTLAGSCLAVKISLLPFDVLTEDILINRKELYYRILVDSSLIGESMKVTLRGDSTNNAFNEAYLKFGQAPSRAIYDHTVEFPFQANQIVVAPDIQFGTYYQMTYGQTPNGNQQEISLLAEILPFEIRRIGANYGGNTGPVTVKIEGGRFEPGMEVRLENPDLSTIFATDVIYLNSTSIWATFDLIGRHLGKYDVALYKDHTFTAGADTAVLDTSFTIQAGPPNGFIGSVRPGTCSPGVSEIGELLQVVINHPPNTRPNRVVSMTIYYENIGNVDLPIPTRFLLSTGGAPIGFTPEELAEGKTELFMELTESGGPPGLLRPGGKGSITIYSKAIEQLSFELIE